MPRNDTPAWYYGNKLREEFDLCEKFENWKCAEGGVYGQGYQDGLRFAFAVMSGTKPPTRYPEEDNEAACEALSVWCEAQDRTIDGTQPRT
ncbi:hypothetical protein LCGC14_1220210 [marine sediment metagenome]|uniref:Uncharacterized protein n=1 Tax=marine sediment metagenome TaxID=412755 RepID=A0A0F9LFJ2_9ZZZZ